MEPYESINFYDTKLKFIERNFKFIEYTLKVDTYSYNSSANLQISIGWNKLDICFKISHRIVT